MRCLRTVPRQHLTLRSLRAMMWSAPVWMRGGFQPRMPTWLPWVVSSDYDGNSRTMGRWNPGGLRSASFSTKPSSSFT